MGRKLEESRPYCIGTKVHSRKDATCQQCGFYEECGKIWIYRKTKQK